MRGDARRADGFDAALSKARARFEAAVKPSLLALWPGGLVADIEGRGNPFDVYAGIDAYRVSGMQEMDGIAVRVQGGKCWRTFTVRRSRDSGAMTEYEKRRSAIENGHLYPKYTLQAYVDGGGLRELAVALTAELMEYIGRFAPLVRHTGGGEVGQASFFVVPWRDVALKGYWLAHVAPDGRGGFDVWRTRGGME